MKRFISFLPVLVALILFSALLAACGGSAPSEEAAATKTRIPLSEEAQPTAAAAEAAVESAAPPEVEAESAAAPANANASDEAYPPPPPPVVEESYPADGAAGQAGGLRTFAIVPEESSASYLVDEEFFQDALAKLGIAAGEVDVVGTTEGISGQIQVNLADLTAPLGATAITADLTGLTTDQESRDRWLQENGGGPQFSSFPEATFTASSISGAPAAYSDGEEVQFQLAGDMTVRGVTAPVIFDVTAVVNGDTLSGTAETRLTMSSFGITPPDFARTLTVADEFGIRVNIVARETG